LWRSFLGAPACHVHGCQTQRNKPRPPTPGVDGVCCPAHHTTHPSPAHATRRTRVCSCVFSTVVPSHWPCAGGLCASAICHHEVTYARKQVAKGLHCLSFSLSGRFLGLRFFVFSAIITTTFGTEWDDVGGLLRGYARGPRAPLQVFVCFIYSMRCLYGAAGPITRRGN